jgi:hypothetical protein
MAVDAAASGDGSGAGEGDDTADDTGETEISARDLATSINREIIRSPRTVRITAGMWGAFKDRLARRAGQGPRSSPGARRLTTRTRAK